MQNYLKQILSIKQQVQSLKDAGMSIIEVPLRVRLTESLIIYGDSLILTDPTPFKNKQIYWQNNATICSEIGRSHDVFIKHNFINHDGKIPLWAAVEVLSFGTLSRIIKNLNTGSGSAFAKLSNYYKFKSQKGNMVTPSNSTLTSWIKSLVILRNTCAHNARIYNTAASAKNRTFMGFPNTVCTTSPVDVSS